MGGGCRWATWFECIAAQRQGMAEGRQRGRQERGSICVFEGVWVLKPASPPPYLPAAHLPAHPSIQQPSRHSLHPPPPCTTPPPPPRIRLLLPVGVCMALRRCGSCSLPAILSARIPSHPQARHSHNPRALPPTARPPTTTHPPCCNIVVQCVMLRWCG